MSAATHSPALLVFTSDVASYWPVDRPCGQRLVFLSQLPAVVPGDYRWSDGDDVVLLATVLGSFLQGIVASGCGFGAVGMVRQVL